jgi:hypothetical protein
MASFFSSFAAGRTAGKAIKVLIGYYKYPANDRVAIDTIQRIADGRATCQRDKNEHNVAVAFLKIRVERLNPNDDADIYAVKSILGKVKNARAQGLITDQFVFDGFCLMVKQKFNIE